MVGTAIRFYAPIVVRDTIETHADLDSCAEYDLVSHDFVKSLHL
jgi:hypothetical protein